LLSNDVILRPYLKQMTLLCVDASPLMQSIYEDIFTTLFHTVLVANDGEEGMVFCQEHDIDLVLCEYDLPQMNGIEMIEQMRQLKPLMPIILVTQTMNIIFSQKPSNTAFVTLYKNHLIQQTCLKLLKGLLKSSLLINSSIKNNEDS